MHQNMTRRISVMMIGLIIMGLGIALFKISLMGNDPCTAMAIAVGETVNVDLPVIMIVMNSLYFLVEGLWGRRYIGIGTFANWFGVGVITSFWLARIDQFILMPQTFLFRLFLMFIGMLFLSLGASMYQTSVLGIAPYDAVSIILAGRTPIPYFMCRVFTDSVCAIAAYMLGGLIGLGTLACAVGLGPFIVFFDRHISKKLCGMKR